MEPPLEEKKDNKIWRLKKAVYGMNDAGRRWYYKIEETLKQLGCYRSKYDHCLFFYRINDVLSGLILIWVDEIFYAETSDSEEDIIAKINEQ